MRFTDSLILISMDLLLALLELAFLEIAIFLLIFLLIYKIIKR